MTFGDLDRKAIKSAIFTQSSREWRKKSSLRSALSCSIRLDSLPVEILANKLLYLFTDETLTHMGSIDVQVRKRLSHPLS